MLGVYLVSFDDLKEEEKEVQPNNGSGKEDANYIKIRHDSSTIMILSDAVEPEDATFRRDFKDVVTAINKVYEAGLNDGKKLEQ